MGYIGIAFGLLIAVAGWAATLFSLSEEGKTAAKYSDMPGNFRTVQWLNWVGL
jgi:hypothetical protein